MNPCRIAVIPGDGIGAEVIPEGVRVLEALAHRTAALHLEFQYFDWGSERYLAHGQMMPDGGLETLGEFDAIYFGSAGDPRVPDHITLWELRLKICQGFEQYANVRPARLLRPLLALARPIWTGSSCVRIRKENTLALGVESTRTIRKRWR